MTYIKPNKSYTSMAQWIDENANNYDKKEDTLFQYLYHLVNMQAHQLAFFTDNESYDMFSLYCASRLLTRVIHPKRTDTPIKSILNYIKHIIAHLKADYEVDTHSHQPENILSFGSSELGTHLLADACAYDQTTYVSTSTDIVAAMMVHLRKLPRKKHSPEWSNICISCLLTFLDHLNDIGSVNTQQGKTRDNIIRRQWTKDPILYHLPESMLNYIRVLVIELKHIIAAELTYRNDVYISPQEVMKNFMAELAEEDIE